VDAELLRISKINPYIQQSQNPVNTEKDMENEKNDISLLSYTMLTDKVKVDDNPYKNKQICIIYGKGYQRIII
jgi:hypothetical protein